jgi:hypothetical protein
MTSSPPNYSGLARIYCIFIFEHFPIYVPLAAKLYFLLQYKKYASRAAGDIGNI